MVPTSDINVGTSVIELEKRKCGDLDEDIDEDIDEEEEADSDAYIKLCILKKIKIEKMKQVDESIIYAPSSNELTRELGIRKCTVLSHYNDLLKEGVLEKHVNRRYIIVAPDREIIETVDILEKRLQFLNK